VQAPREQIRRVLGVAVQEPEQAEPRHQDERALGRLEQRDGAEACRTGI
jgi:hypothetical protein